MSNRTLTTNPFVSEAQRITLNWSSEETILYNKCVEQVMNALASELKDMLVDIDARIAMCS